MSTAPDHLPADLDEALREVVLARARARGVSQNALGRAAGRSTASMSQRMAGVGTFTVTEWDRMAEALAADLEQLLAEARQLLAHTR